MPVQIILIALLIHLGAVDSNAVQILANPVWNAQLMVMVAPQFCKVLMGLLLSKPDFAVI